MHVPSPKPESKIPCARPHAPGPTHNKPPRIPLTELPHPRRPQLIPEPLITCRKPSCGAACGGDEPEGSPLQWERLRARVRVRVRVRVRDHHCSGGDSELGSIRTRVRVLVWTLCRSDFRKACQSAGQVSERHVVRRNGTLDVPQYASSYR